MPPNGAPRVIVAGELMLDVLFLSDEPGSHEPAGRAGSCGGLFVRPGGSAANVALSLVDSGRPAAVVGKTGPDPNGTWLSERLTSRGVSLTLPPAPSLVTGYVIIHRRLAVDHVVYVERGANRAFGSEDLNGKPDGRLLEGAGWLHVSGYSLIEPGPAEGVRRLAAEARRRGVPISLDPGVPRAFQHVGAAGALELCRLGLAEGPDVLLPSAAMARFLEGAAAGSVVVKDGPGGAWVAGRRVPLDPEAVVVGADVSGAGDAFNAAYIAAASGGASPSEAAESGNRAASDYVRAAVAGETSPGEDWIRVARQEPPLLLSACLVGTASAYDGLARKADLGEEEIRPDRRLCLPICPEQLGGLETPRIPSEIRGGGGHDVIFGRAVVVDRDGREVSEAFLRGARKVLSLARAVGAGRAVLKEGSPSCGVTVIHDGTFSGKTVPGVGVTAAALEKLGLEVEPAGE